MANAPNLGTAQQFAVLGKSGVTGSTGLGTIVDGDVGSSPTPSITNFPPSSVLPPFALHTTNDATVIQAQVDATLAYNFLLAQGAGTVIPTQLNGQTLTPDVYSSLSGTFDLSASGTLIFDGAGVYVFQMDSTLVANVLSNMVFINGADPCNVFWRVGSSATLNGITAGGTVIANASITVGDGSNVTGRLLAGTGATGAVTMAGDGGNTIGGCSSPASCPVITVNPVALPVGQDGVAYNETVSGSGGTAPYTFVVTSGALPTGLVLNPTTGNISGTPIGAGTFNFTITATDDDGCIGSRDYTLIINASSCPIITLSPATLPNGRLRIPYAKVITTSGGEPPITFAVFSGALPTGLTLGATTGIISGRPTVVGVFTFAISATDENGCVGLQAYSIRIGRVTGGLPVTYSNCPPCR